jgi:hypothetical protein
MVSSRAAGGSQHASIVLSQLRGNFCPNLAERVAAGEFMHTLGSNELLILLLIQRGLSGEEARELIEGTPSYAYKKACADSLQRAENARQERIRKYAPPVSGLWMSELQKLEQRSPRRRRSSVGSCGNEDRLD